MIDLLKSPFYINHADRLVDSYKLLTGNDLFPLFEEGYESKNRNVERIQSASFVLVSHGLGPDPLFNYANPNALNLFEISWDELLKMPSRLSAETINQDERAKLLNTVNRQGYIENYSGIRISAKGRRFRINQAVVWNIIDDKGKYFGQGAMFKDWDFL
jgi:hypothetical protein